MKSFIPFAVKRAKSDADLATVVSSARDNGTLPKTLRDLLGRTSPHWADFRNLGIIGTACDDPASFAVFEQIMLDRIASGIPVPVVNMTALRRSGVQGPARNLLRRLKYGDKRLKGPENLMDMAAGIEANVDISDPVFSYLYEISNCKLGSRAEWEREIRLSLAIETVISDFSLNLQQRVTLFDPAALQQMTDELTGDGGLLVAFHHGGFASLRLPIFESLFPDALVITNSSEKERRLDVSEANGAALVVAARSLMRGGTVTIAPDGKQGDGGVDVAVAGRVVQIGEGSAFLAHESGARTAWVMMGRDGDRFVPIWRLGPQREKGERYKDFRNRFFEFYGTCLNDFFTGPPANLVFAMMWNGRLKGK